LTEYRKKHQWKTEDNVKTLAVDGRRKENKTKIECLTWNYWKSKSLRLGGFNYV